MTDLESHTEIKPLVCVSAYLCVSPTYMLVRRLSCLCWKEGDGVTASRADWLTRAAISCKRREGHHSVMTRHLATSSGSVLMTGTSMPWSTDQAVTQSLYYNKNAAKNWTHLRIFTQIYPLRNVVYGCNPLQGHRNDYLYLVNIVI